MLLFVALFSISVSAQDKATKLDVYLNGMAQNGVVTVDGSRHKAVRKNAMQKDCVVVNAVLEKGASLPEKQLSDLGIEVESEIGRFVCLVVPVEHIAELDNLKGFEQFELNRAAKPNNQRSQQAMEVDKVQNLSQAQTAGLSQTYTGKGVVVGVFDTGIDFNHNNFRKPEDGHATRILQANVYSGSATSPSKTATTANTIDALTSDCTDESHGTHTSSTAAGSYNGKYVDQNGNQSYSGQKGVAHEADLVLCGTPALYLNQMQNAMNTMDQVATANNEPLVVNLSLGTTGDWMDGTNTSCKFFDTFTDNGNKPGRIVCISAGNEGDTKFTMYRELNSANNRTIRTFMPNLSTYNGVTCFFPQVFIYVDDATPVTVEFEQYNSSFALQKTYSESSFSSALIHETYSAHDGRYAVNINSSFRTYFNSGSTDVWAMKITSQRDCKVRVFAYYYNGGASYECDMESKDRSGFVSGDATSSFNSMACTNSVLSVGAWQVSKTIDHGYDGSSHTYAISSSNNDIVDFSSWVESDDNGVTRPDFAAPGVAVISGYNSYDQTVWKSGTSQNWQVAGKASENWLSGHTSIIGGMCGTSMSCPNAVGVIALWLQADPTLSVNRVREIIKATADTDEMTRAQSCRFGAGKLNALAGLKMIARKEVAVSDVEYATFYAGHNVIIPEGVEVYAPQLSKDSKSLVMGAPLEVGTILPAKVGVIVKASEASYTFVATNNEADDITSCLSGSIVSEPVTNFDGQIYSLAREDGETGFFRYTGSTTAAGKAFLVLKNSEGARQLNFLFDDSTTGITTAVEEPETDVVYSISGQKLSGNRANGIYIKNGKKIIK